jgi:hypothetical protein
MYHLKVQSILTKITSNFSKYLVTAVFKALSSRVSRYSLHATCSQILFEVAFNKSKSFTTYSYATIVFENNFCRNYKGTENSNITLKMF